MPIRTYTQPSAVAAASAGRPSLAARQLSGCFTVVGPLEICWALSTDPIGASIQLKLFGQTILSGEIDPQNPCIEFEDSVPFVEFKISVCLAGSKITAKGEACAFGNCIDFDVTLIEW